VIAVEESKWRLPGLKAALAAGTVQPFEKLRATADEQFYEDDEGTNYAQARYLCYWLQEQGLLEDFHREFVAAAQEDPSGFATLSRIVGYERDMSVFDAKWRKFVLGLRFG
jgi:hypothetical protein